MFTCYLLLLALLTVAISHLMPLYSQVLANFADWLDFKLN